MKEHNKTTVYDWPTRIFHGHFALLFVIAYLIAETVSDESSLFSLHVMAGLIVGFILILQIIWGFAQTTHARFSSFKLNLKDAVVPKTKNYLGHNPGSSYASFLMFVCSAGLAIIGVMMAGSGETDFNEESHELLANIFFITVTAHVGGVIFYHDKYRDSL